MSKTNAGALDMFPHSALNSFLSFIPAERKPTQTEWCTDKELNTGDYWWNNDLWREKLTKEKVNTAADLKHGNEEMVP